MSDITYENKKSHSLKTSIILMLAITLTCVSLAMITEASWKRSGSLMEAVIMSFLAGGVALSAHLLPALTKKRVGKFGWGIVSAIWVVAVLVTLYSHTIFFVSTMTEAGNSRANKSSQVQDIKTLSEENKKLMTNTDARSVVAISRDIANVDIQINQLIPRACDNCKKIKGNIAGLEAKKDALKIEMDEAKRVADLRDQAIKMDQKAAEIKNNARLDPVTEKLVSIFDGMNVNGVTLLISVINAALLEMLASLFWWLVWPDKKLVEPDTGIKKDLNKRKRPENILVESNQGRLLEKNENDKSLPLENKVKVLSAAIDQVIYNDILIDRKNEDIFIDPYVSKIISIYKEKDERKVDPKFIEEDINVVSFVRNITAKYPEKNNFIEESINIQKFEEQEKPLSNFDSLFNNSFIEDSMDIRNKEVNERPKESIISDKKNVVIESETNNEKEKLLSKTDEVSSRLVLDESNEVEIEEVKNAEIFLEEEDKKTAGSDIIYTRPRFKPSEIITVNTHHNKENIENILKKEEDEDVYKMEKMVAHFGSDKMENDLKKIAGQFSKKTEEVSEDVEFEIPVLVNKYDEESEKKSLYINKRKLNNQENAPGPEDVLKDLFPDVDFINDLAKK